MSDRHPRIETTLHRAWPCECVVVRGEDPTGLAAALGSAHGRLARDPGIALAVAARDITERGGSGRLAAGIVADSREQLAARLEHAREWISSGAVRVAEDGVYFEREPRCASGRAVWLFEGAESVRPGMFRDLALWLPGCVDAFDRAAELHPEPGNVADFLCGPNGAAELDATTRARLALAAGRIMTTWLLRILPAPSRALGGPGAGRPWLDTRDISPEQFDACQLAAVAAVSTAEWDHVLGALPEDPAAVILHVGPGPAPRGRRDIIALHSQGADELRGFLDGLARLAAAGLAVDLRPLFDLRGVPAPEPPEKTAPSRRSVVFQPRSPRFDARGVTLPAGAARCAAPPEPAPAAAQDPRAEIVLEHLETMRRFLDGHQAAVLRFQGQVTEHPPERTQAHRPDGPLTPSRAGPMLHQVRELVPGERVTASAHYDVNEAVFLKQHTPNVSAVSSIRPDAFGLPVMPLTFSMEALAEAAALLAPDRVVTGFEQLEAQRWMTFERDAVDVTITAEVVKRGDRLEVSAAILDPADPRRVYLSGRVLLEHAYPPAPEAPVWSDPDAMSCGWGVEAIYPLRGFHGPMLRAITRVDRHGEAGMTGELTVLHRSPLFASTPEPAFQVDPVLLDSLGMSVGIWTWREAMNGVYPVPFRVKRIRLYGPPCPEGETLRMQVRIGRNSDGMIAADLFAARADGLLHAEAEQWEDYVYRLPLAVHRIARDPFGQLIASPVAPLITGTRWDDIAIAEFPSLAPAFFTAAEGIWEKILAWYWLSPPERKDWISMNNDPARRHAWLKGRAAVKDAVRQLLASRGRKVGAYDVPIRTSENGRPLAEGVSVSLADCGDRVWAAAGDAERGALGIEVDTPAAMNDQVAGAAFTPEDLRRLRALAGDWITRAWCAKRAAAKAFDTGPDLDSRALQIGGIDAPTGCIGLKPTGPWSALPGVPDEIEVATARHGEHVLALCRIAAS
jgi:hypothetical protein